MIKVKLLRLTEFNHKHYKYIKSAIAVMQWRFLFSV